MNYLLQCWLSSAKANKIISSAEKCIYKSIYAPSVRILTYSMLEEPVEETINVGVTFMCYKYSVNPQIIAQKAVTVFLPSLWPQMFFN